MKIWIESIQFSMPSNGSLEISVNDGFGGRTRVLGPEWRRDGVSSLPSVFMPLGSGSKIRVSFSSDVMTAFQTSIGATEATAGQNILGPVATKSITFQAGSSSAEMNLPSPVLGTVRTHFDEWHWFFEQMGNRNPLENEVTRHQIHSVLKRPSAPWFAGSEDTIPWHEALELACNWAEGATHEREALTRVSRKFYSFGQTQPRKFSYRATMRFTSFRLFNLQKFLAYFSDSSQHCDCQTPSTCQKLNCGAVNCSDCATIISTFSALLGVASRQEYIAGSGPGSATSPVCLIGSPAPAVFTFQAHEIAWDGGADDDSDRVWDACLGRVSLGQQVALPFTNLPFDVPGPSDYKGTALNPKMAGQIVRAGDVQNRSIGSFRSHINALPPSDERRFGFRDWAGTFREFRGMTFVNFFFQSGWLEGWTLETADRLDRAPRPWLHEAIFAVDKRRIAVSVTECTTREQAHFALAEMLGADRQVGFEDPSPLLIGDICFHDPVRIPDWMYFARGNLIIRLCKAPGDCAELRPLAEALDNRLKPSPQVIGNALERVPKDSNALPLQLPDPKDRERWLRLSSETCEMRVENDHLFLEAPSPETHNISMVQYLGRTINSSLVLQFNVF